MKTWKKTLPLVLLAAAAGLAVGSTQQDRSQEPTRADVEGMMEAYVLSKLQDALSLSDEQFGSLVVAQKKLQDTRRAYREDRTRMLRELRQTLRHDAAGASELDPMLDELRERRVSFFEEETSRYEAIDEILDVRQRARYRVLEVELQRRLNELMRRVRGARDERRGALR